MYNRNHDMTESVLHSENLCSRYVPKPALRITACKTTGLETGMQIIRYSRSHKLN